MPALAGARRALLLAAALSSVVIPPSLALPIVSGSVKAKMMSGQGGTLSGSEKAIHRQRDKSNVRAADFWHEYVDGRILSNGVFGQSIEVPLSDGASKKWRAATLIATSGTGKNQSGADLVKHTFFEMLNDAAFVAAGGAVSSDGFTLTTPANAFTRFRTDRATAKVLAKGAAYMVQTECVAADGTAKQNPRGRVCRPDLGDYNYAVAAGDTADWVFQKDWSTVGGSAALGNAFGPVATLGTGEAGVQCVGVHMDSIGTEAAVPGTGVGATSDYGDADGVQNWCKRALNAAGYSFIDVGVSGTNVGNLMAGFNKTGLRMSLLQYTDVVISGHLHNDRRSGVTFDAVAGWSEGAPSTWNSTGLKTRYNWHNDFLRTKMRATGPKRIVQATLDPQTQGIKPTAASQSGTTVTLTVADTSGLVNGSTVDIAGFTPSGYNATGVALTVVSATQVSYTATASGVAAVTAFGTINDRWRTVANQFGKNDDSQFAADYATGTNGDQFKLNDLIMRRGAYASLAYGEAGEVDAGYDLAATVLDGVTGSALNGSGRFRVNGADNYATGDGTHRSEAFQIAAANDLLQRLPVLLGFAA